MSEWEFKEKLDPSIVEENISQLEGNEVAILSENVEIPAQAKSRVSPLTWPEKTTIEGDF